VGGIAVKLMGTRAAFIFAILLLSMTLDFAPAQSTRPTTVPSTQPTLSPLRITLHFHNAPVLEIVKSIQWQTGLSLYADPRVFGQFAGNKPATIDIDNAIFWDAMRVLKEKTNLGAIRVNDTGNGRLYMLFPVPGMHDFPPTNEYGLFSIAPVGAFLNRAMRYGGTGQDSSLCISLQVLDDPSIDLAHAKYDVSIQKAVDENGKNLATGAPAKPSNEQFKAMHVVGRRVQPGGMMSVTNQTLVPLADSAANGKQIKLLVGAIHVTSTASFCQLRFFDPAADSELSMTGTTVRILQFTPQKQQCLVRLHIEQAQGAIAWDPGASPETTYTLIDENGDLFRGHSVAFDKGQSTCAIMLMPIPRVNGFVPVQNLPAGTVPPATQAASAVHRSLMISIPGGPIDFTVPFELKDLALP
jgi:hypothetical protein